MTFIIYNKCFKLIKEYSVYSNDKDQKIIREIINSIEEQRGGEQ